MGVPLHLLKCVLGSAVYDYLSRFEIPKASGVS